MLVYTLMDLKYTSYQYYEKEKYEYEYHDKRITKIRGYRGDRGKIHVKKTTHSLNVPP